MTLKSAYNTSPDDIQEGDEFCFVVKLLVFRKTTTDQPLYRIYRCEYEGDEAPKGARIDTDLEVAVMQALFPVVGWARGMVDPL